jgi:hypothetical protein
MVEKCAGARGWALVGFILAQNGGEEEGIGEKSFEGGQVPGRAPSS